MKHEEYLNRNEALFSTRDLALASVQCGSLWWWWVGEAGRWVVVASGEGWVVDGLWALDEESVCGCKIKV